MACRLEVGIMIEGGQLLQPCSASVVPGDILFKIHGQEPARCGPSQPPLIMKLVLLMLPRLTAGGG